MNPRLVLVLLALVAMTTSMTIRDGNEENHHDLVRQDIICIIIIQVEQHHFNCCAERQILF